MRLRKKEVQRGSFLLLATVGLLISALTLQQPMEVYGSIDPGLDSGNAVIDRTSVPGETILRYETTGNSTFAAPAGVTDVRVLVVGGGGGGGAGELTAAGDGGGAGGAGEYLHETSFAVTPGVAATVTVGGGGNGSTTNQNDGGTTAQNGANGSNSIFSTLTARGGGGGGGNDQHGLAGGSGGGAGGHCTSSATNGGASTAVPPGVGNAGGNSPAGSCTPRGAAGGGGAGAVGTSGSGGSGGVGAIGLQNDITGTNSLYTAGGGGGGGSSSGSGANGGSSIGGKGGNASGGNGVVGTANTGSGGGGGGSTNSSSTGNGGNGGSGVVIVRFATQNLPDPGGVAGARMWYKADSSGNTNAQWNDFSGFGHNLTQGTAGNQPALTTNSINFNPAYVFDGGNDEFSMPTHGIGGSEPISAFYVALSNSASGGYRYFNEFGDDTPSISMNNGKPDLYVRGTSPIQYTYTAQAVGTPSIYGFISPNANNQSRIVSVDDSEQTQNVTSGTYTTSSGSQSGNSFGNTNGSSGTGWSGPIAEAIYFNKVLAPGERLHVISYLGIKYGITRHQAASGSGYVDSGTATIWNADSTFKNDIAGIGRDDASTLNQKQSKSVNGDSLVTIGHGGIAATNQDNTNDFGADQTFLMWGNDDGSTTATAAVSGTTYQRMERIWKSVATSSPGSVEVQIPTSEAGGNDTLLISDSPTFDGTAQEVPMSVDGANYEATTAALSSGTHYFTFAENVGSDIEFVSKAATDIGGTPLTNYTPGQPLQYELTVRNNGPADAGLVTVTDTLPAGIEPTQVTGGGWSCDPISGQTITCNRTALNNGATAPVIVVEAKIASSVTGQKINNASVSVANDPDTSNNSASVTLDAAPEADLSITKAHTGTPTAGNPLTYDFTVTNDGPSDVSEFTVTDNFDSNLTFSSATAEVNCMGTTNVTCTSAAPLASGDSRNFSITVNVDGGFGGGSVNNTATVAPPAGTTDPNSANDSSDDDTNVIVTTDLTVSKTHTGNFTAGENNTFTINATNNGPSDAPTGSISITDTLDEDFSYVSAAGPNWTCNPPPATTVNCTYNAALTSTSTTSDITLTVLVDPIVKGSTTNTATVSGTTPDPTLGNNSSTDNITIEAEADLAITKAAVGDPFTPGTQEQFTFSVVNNGPSADTPTYTITDTLPAGLSYASYSGPADCSMSSGINVSCTGGGIGAGDPAQVTTITVNVDSSASGSVNNTATVAPDPSVTDPTPGNDSSTINVNFEPNADLSITKTPPGSMTAGDTADYTLTTTNNGPSNVSSYTVTDNLDPNLTFQSSTPGGACTVTGTTPQGGEELTCTGGAITASGQDAITITVAVASTATSGSTISNTATVAAPAGVNDPTPGNNISAQVDNTVDGEADLAITKSHTGNFTVGGNGTFTIEVTNNGPSDADTVTVIDVLPDGLTYVNATSPNAACDNAGQTVTCTIGPTMSNAEVVDITLEVMVDSDVTASSIENTASVSSATTDPTPGNNSDPDTVTIETAEADLTATKAAQGSLTAGEPVTYRFEVTNNGGPDNAGVVTITDNLPSYLTYQSFNSVSGGTWDCGGSSGQDVTCTLGVLAVNDTAVVDVTVLVAQDAPDTANNSASVAFNGTDPTPANPSTSESVSHSADLEVTITHEEKTYSSGDTIDLTYTVMNHGPSAAEDVVLTGDIPEGVTITNISATEPGGSSILSALDRFFSPKAHAADNPFTCSLNGQIVCNASTLFVGTYPLYVTAQIGDSFTGDLVFTASVTSSTTDPNGADTTATDTVESVLAATGQSILPWITGALAAIAAAVGLSLYLRRNSKQRTSS